MHTYIYIYTYTTESSIIEVGVLRDENILLDTDMKIKVGPNVMEEILFHKLILIEYIDFKFLSCR